MRIRYLINCSYNLTVFFLFILTKFNVMFVNKIKLEYVIKYILHIMNFIFYSNVLAYIHYVFIGKQKL